VAEPAREIPDVAGIEVDDLRLALRVDGGNAALALDDIGPLRRIGVPVQFAQAPGDERHQHAGDRLRHREVHHRRLFRPAAVPRFGRDRAEPEAERRQLGAGERRRGRPERRLSLAESLRARCSRRHAAGRGRAQHVAT